MATIYSAEDLQLLIEQTCKLRRDPVEYKKEVDRIDNEKFLEDNKDEIFVAADGEILDFSEFV